MFYYWRATAKIPKYIMFPHWSTIIGVTKGPRRRAPQKCLEYFVIFCFGKRYPKQNTFVSLKSLILGLRKFFVPTKILGWYATVRRIMIRLPPTNDCDRRNHKILAVSERPHQGFTFEELQNVLSKICDIKPNTTRNPRRKI